MTLFLQTINVPWHWDQASYFLLHPLVLLAGLQKRSCRVLRWCEWAGGSTVRGDIIQTECKHMSCDSSKQLYWSRHERTIETMIPSFTLVALAYAQCITTALTGCQIKPKSLYTHTSLLFQSGLFGSWNSCDQLRHCPVETPPTPLYLHLPDGSWSVMIWSLC